MGDNKRQNENDYSEITFQCHNKWFGEIPEIKPSYEKLPEWFEDTPATLAEIQNRSNVEVERGEQRIEKLKNSDASGFEIGSVKRCLPFTEALSIGWIVSLPADLHIKQEDGEVKFEHNIEFEMISRFDHDMIEHTYPEEILPFQVITPWSMSAVNENWSFLITPPMNRPNTVFESSSGVLNIGSEPTPVSTVLFLKQTEFEGVIEKGTPICQLIPIHRTDIPKKYKIVDSDKNENKNNFNRVNGYIENVWTETHRAKNTET